MHEDIQYFSYKMKGEPIFITGYERQEAKACCKAFLQIQVFPAIEHTLFLSEDQITNSQNNHWFALSPQDVPIVMKSKHPVHIKVFGVVTSNDDIMPRTQHRGQHQVLGEDSAGLDQDPPAGRPHVCQQDYLPCHTNRSFVCQKITPNIWLPNSPDYNTLDYYVWGVVQQENNKTLCNTKYEQKAKIIPAFTNLKNFVSLDLLMFILVTTNTQTIPNPHYYNITINKSVFCQYFVNNFFSNLLPWRKKILTFIWLPFKAKLNNIDIIAAILLKEKYCAIILVDLNWPDTILFGFFFFFCIQNYLHSMLNLFTNAIIFFLFKADMFYNKVGN